MIIKVGSQNPTKIASVKNLLTNHELFENAMVEGVSVEVEEFGHPKTLEETIIGAKQRAELAFGDCLYSIGLESGMFEAPETKSGYLETTACVIYDGSRFHLGLSPSFEWPAEVVKLILQGLDGSQAFKQVGLTDDQKVGTQNGAIHVLTHGKIDRVKLNELALAMALIHLENPEHY